MFTVYQIDLRSVRVKHKSDRQRSDATGSSHGVGVGQHTSDLTNDPKQAYLSQGVVGEEVGEHQTDSSSIIMEILEILMQTHHQG